LQEDISSTTDQIRKTKEQISKIQNKRLKEVSSLKN